MKHINSGRGGTQAEAAPNGAASFFQTCDACLKKASHTLHELNTVSSHLIFILIIVAREKASASRGADKEFIINSSGMLPVFREADGAEEYK